MWKDVGEAIMGPAFRNPYAESNARSAELFNFLNEALSEPRPSSPATYVVNAESLKEMSDRGIEPQLSIKNSHGGKYEHFKVSDIEGLNQWIYDPTLLYETKVSVLKIIKAHQLKTEGTYTVYTLTFAGLNFRGSQILAIFAFLFSRTQGLSL